MTDDCVDRLAHQRPPTEQETGVRRRRAAPGIQIDCGVGNVRSSQPGACEFAHIPVQVLAQRESAPRDPGLGGVVVPEASVIGNRRWRDQIWTTGGSMR